MWWPGAVMSNFFPMDEGIPETRAVLDGGRLRELAAEVTSIWD